MTRPRVHVLCELDLAGQPLSSTYVRLVVPFGQPSFRRELDVTYGSEVVDLPAHGADIRGPTSGGSAADRPAPSDSRLGHGHPDVLVVDRLWNRDATALDAQRLVDRTRAGGSALVYALDDNLLDLDVELPRAPWPKVEQRMAIRYLAREADLVVAATDPMRARLSGFRSEVRVIRNGLDRRLFGPTEGWAREQGLDHGQRPRRVIGYMGTRTHDDDFMLIVGALREVLRRHAEGWDLHVVGAIRDRLTMQTLQGLPARVTGPSVKLDYPSFASWAADNMTWDIGLAPLVDTPFNRCKSDIKHLDYGALGIPGIYSRVAPYEGSVRHRETGWLAANTTDAWVEGLEALIRDEDLRARIARDARAYVEAERSAEQCAQAWIEAIDSVVGRPERRAVGVASGAEVGP